MKAENMVGKAKIVKKITMSRIRLKMKVSPPETFKKYHVERLLRLWVWKLLKSQVEIKVSQVETMPTLKSLFQGGV